MRLLLIEDNRPLSELVARALRQMHYAVDVAYCGTDGIELASIYEYDLISIDRTLEDGDGLEYCRTIRNQHPSLPILMLTATIEHEDPRLDCARCLDAGADDYIAKPFLIEEVAARVRALLRRSGPVQLPLLRHRELVLDQASLTAYLAEQPLTLTRKEFAILTYLLQHRGKVISQEALLEHVWDSAANPFSNTIRTHMSALRRKIGSSYITTIIGAGYRLD